MGVGAKQRKVSADSRPRLHPLRGRFANRWRIPRARCFPQGRGKQPPQSARFRSYSGFRVQADCRWWESPSQGCSGRGFGAPSQSTAALTRRRIWPNHHAARAIRPSRGGGISGFAPSKLSSSCSIVAICFPFMRAIFLQGVGQIPSGLKIIFPRKPPPKERQAGWKHVIGGRHPGGSGT